MDIFKDNGCWCLCIGSLRITNLNHRDPACGDGYCGKPWEKWFTHWFFERKKDCGFVWFLFCGIEVFKD